MQAYRPFIIAAATTSLSAAVLANAVVTDAAGLSSRVPNLHIGKANANMEISIRAINSTNSRIIEGSSTLL